MHLLYFAFFLGMTAPAALAGDMAVYNKEIFGFSKSAYAANESELNCTKIIDNAIEHAIKPGQQKQFLDCLISDGISSETLPSPDTPSWQHEGWRNPWSADSGNYPAIPWAFERIPG